jgi:hypothetical protein
VRRAAIGLLLALGACGGGAPPPAAVDTTLRNQLAAGRLALEAGRNAEAARQYALALDRARALDSAPDLAEAATGRAAALVADGDARAALAEAEAARAVLERRGAPVPDTLRLAEATARYRSGDMIGARSLLDPWPAGGDADAALRAAFLLGLIAADSRDVTTLAVARGRLGTPAAEGFRADAAELAAHAALLAGDAATAEAAALEAVAARRAALDPRGVTRALLLAADASAALGAREREADHALRAGQSAAARGDHAEAARHLQRARAASADPTLRRAALRALDDLPR